MNIFCALQILPDVTVRKEDILTCSASQSVEMIEKAGVGGVWGFSFSDPARCSPVFYCPHAESLQWAYDMHAF